MQITYSYAGRVLRKKFELKEILIGRPDGIKMPDLDLSPDFTVSRKHARLWFENGCWWIEDFDSRFGTMICGEKITGKRQLKVSEPIVIGETTIEVEIQVETSLAPETVALGNKPKAPEPMIEKVLDAKTATAFPIEIPSSETQQRFSLLLGLPVQFAQQTRLGDLLQLIIERLVGMTPGAQRGSLVLLDRPTDQLVLKAYVSPSEPSYSESLARRAMSECRGFIWRREAASDLSETLRQQDIGTGMYAPLIWSQKPLGVIMVDNTGREKVFREEDLRFMIALAHYAAMAVANYQLQEDLLLNAKLLERLLTSFSPKIRNCLLERAHRGRLRTGGEKSEVAVLMADMRNFTNTVANLDAEDVADLLHDYLSALVDAVFRFDGTIDKFVGDGILAVFGSPEPDPQRHENAVRAALAMQSATQMVNAQRESRGEKTCELGIGLHCGEVWHGFIGAAERLEFTVVGDAVNRVSRFCSGAQAGEVLVSSDLYQRVFKMVQAEKTSFTTKHGDKLEAFRVKALKETKRSPGI